MVLFFFYQDEDEGYRNQSKSKFHFPTISHKLLNYSTNVNYIWLIIYDDLKGVGKQIPTRIILIPHFFYSHQLNQAYDL